jgi:beta-glucosidase
VGSDPTGDICAVGGLPAACSSAGAQHVGGIPGTGCDAQEGCGLVNAVVTGNLPLSVFNQALAEVLYQEQRFGLLGCTSSPPAKTCTNPGGVHGVRTGIAPLPAGPAAGATAAANLGTENGDAAVVERMAEEGAVLLKHTGAALPLTSGDLSHGVAVSGPGAEYLIAEPSNEASTGFSNRIAISPLLQLEDLSGRPSAFSFAPAQDPTGFVVPSSQLSTSSTTVTHGLTRMTGPGSPRVDTQLDFTTVSSWRPLAAGDYTWTGYVYVPRADTYTFRFQLTPGTTTGSTPAVAFTLDGQSQQLSAASSFYCGQYYSHNVCLPTGTTNAGYTQGSLSNEQTSATALSAGSHLVTIAFRNDSGHNASFRFAYSRAAGDVADAAAAAKAKGAAVVFVNDNGVSVVNQDAYTPPSSGVATLPAQDVQLVDDVAAVNPNTIVVMNTADPVIVKPWIDNPHVKAVLEMWNAGSEGGTATARLLLGQADPSGHTVLTWPTAPGDTIWSYRQTRSLYPGEKLGRPRAPQRPRRLQPGRLLFVRSGAQPVHQNLPQSGHLLRLPLLRSRGLGPGVSVRLRTVLHPVPLLEPGRPPLGRRAGRLLLGHQRRFAGRDRRGAGLRRFRPHPAGRAAGGAGAAGLCPGAAGPRPDEP